MPVEGGNDCRRSVLVVEDSENSAAMLEIAFSGIPDVSVLMAPSAVEALRILHNGTTIQAIVTT